MPLTTAFLLVLFYLSLLSYYFLSFVLFFHVSNFLLDYFGKRSSKIFKLENSLRVVIFIAPAFIVLFVFEIRKLKNALFFVAFA